MLSAVSQNCFISAIEHVMKFGSVLETLNARNLSSMWPIRTEEYCKESSSFSRSFFMDVYVQTVYLVVFIPKKAWFVLS
jgi:hypothetical protein